MLKEKIKHLKTKISTKLMLSYLVIILIPMILIAIFFFSTIYDMILADSIRRVQTESASTAPQIEDVIDRIVADSESVRGLALDTPLQSYGHDISRQQILDAYQNYSLPGKLEHVLQDSPILTVKVYMDLDEPASEQLSQSTKQIIEPLRNAKGTYWFGIFSGLGVTSLHCPGFYLSHYEIDNYGDMAYISYQTILFENEPRTCFVACYYSSENYIDRLLNSFSFQGGAAYIINERDAMIATTDERLSSTYYLDYATVQDSFMSSNNFLTKQSRNEEVYAAMYNIRSPGWYLIVVMPSQPIISQSKTLMAAYISLFLICAVFSFFIAGRMSRTITGRLSALTLKMTEARNGPPQPLDNPPIADEIGTLIDAYNYMSAEMNQLLLDKESAYKELHIAEFNSLQAQINPHFLYNTMEMINWLAYQGQTDEIMDTVQSLSRFYKLTLSKKEMLSNLNDEIEHVEIYVKLQNMKLKDQITLIIDIPDMILDCEIPTLTLQPLVENAILHGIMEKEDKCGSIVITAKETGPAIEIMVSDDGVGIPSDVVEHILTEKARSGRHNNIAIYNTHHRLQILYGPEYGLSYDTILGEGTDVFIRLPGQSMQK